MTAPSALRYFGIFEIKTRKPSSPSVAPIVSPINNSDNMEMMKYGIINRDNPFVRTFGKGSSL